MARGSLNKVMLIGNIGRDLELKYTPQGQAVCEIALATDESYKDKQSGQMVQQVEWHRLVAWRGLAENAAKYLQKGNKIYIEGKLQTRNWEKEGQKHYTTEIILSDIKFSPSGKKDGAPVQGQSVPQPNQQPDYDIPDTDFDDDDLPF